MSLTQAVAYIDREELHRALERGQFRNFFFAVFFTFLGQYHIFRWLEACLTQFSPTLYRKTG